MKTNGLGIASLVVGIVGIIMTPIPLLNLVGGGIATVGLILGIIGLTLKNRSKTLAIVGTVLSALAMIGSLILAFVYGNWIWSAVEAATKADVTQEVRQSSEAFGDYGSDPALDALWDACTARDWQACDDLYSQSPAGSTYESYGDTCGYRNNPDTWCTELYASGATVSPDLGSTAYGANAYLDQLWDECGAGVWTSCDQLYADSPEDSIYHAFADTCGYRIAAGSGVWCEDYFGQGYTSDVQYGQYGSDSYLDSLWNECGEGSMEACDSLYMDSPSGSDYEYFGDTCGYRQEPGTGVFCVDRFQSS